METNQGEMETVAGGLPLPIPEGPFFDVLSRLSIKDLHRSTVLSSHWRNVFINFPNSRKHLPQTLQGFLYLSCDCRRHGPGGDDRDSDDEGDGARGDDDSDDGSGTDKDGDSSGNRNGNSSGDSDGSEDEDGSGNRDGSSYYGGHVGNRDDGSGDDEVGPGRDSACSGNYELHFLDLLAKSMPVPDDTDTELSFIPLLAHVGRINFLCSCNGLLLFGCKERSESYHSQGYIVCNPATKQWRMVPRSGWVPPKDEERHHTDEDFESTFLFFDPAVPSRFLLIQFWHDENAALIEDEGVHIYSSETGEWSNRSREWIQLAREGEWGDKYGVNIQSWLGSSFLNGMLHFFVERMKKNDVLIVAVDGQGSICRIMHWPLRLYNEAVFIGQSQGRLHCISANFLHQNEDQRHKIMMCVDVLQDYDAERWQIGGFGIRGSKLSGGEECRRKDYEVVAFHPDGNLIYFIDHRKGKLIQYDIGGNYPENEQVLRLCTHGRSLREVIPYVPCFSRSSALDTNDEASENPV